jgi:hypothetical protein
MLEDPVVGNGGTDEGIHCSFFSLGEDELLLSLRVVGVSPISKVLDQGPAAAVLRLGNLSGAKTTCAQNMPQATRNSKTAIGNQGD